MNAFLGRFWGKHKKLLSTIKSLYQSSNLVKSNNYVQLKT